MPTQINGPILSLTHVYSTVNETLGETEKLLDLLNKPTDIKDKPNAPDLVVSRGEIEFRALVLPGMIFDH